MLTRTGSRGLEALAYGKIIGERMRRTGYTLGDPKPFVVDLPSERGARLLGRDASAFERLTLARKVIGALVEQRSERITLVADAPEPGVAGLSREALHAAMLATDFALPDYQSTRTKRADRRRPAGSMWTWPRETTKAARPCAERRHRFGVRFARDLLLDKRVDGNVAASAWRQSIRANFTTRNISDSG